jgi:hypothetical protein
LASIGGRFLAAGAVLHPAINATKTTHASNAQNRTMPHRANARAAFTKHVRTVSLHRGDFNATAHPTHSHP